MGQDVVTSAEDGPVIRWSTTGERLARWRLGTGAAVLSVAPSGIHVAVEAATGTVYLLKLRNP